MTLRNSSSSASKKAFFDEESSSQADCAIYSIYTPSARCLDLCPRSDMKRFTEKSLATVEYMCMERYDGMCLIQSWSGCKDR